MNREFQYKMAKQKGETIAKKFGNNTLPVDILAIAKQRNIEVNSMPNSKKGVSGMLLRQGESYGIMYATYIDNKGFQRFSIAHELGHYFLEGHIDHVFPIGQDIHSSKANFISDNLYEREADCFAVGLLMPECLVQPIIAKTKDAGLAVVEQIAKSCQTSLVSSAIRYVELSQYAVGVILSTSGKIDYCFLSQSMKDLPNIDWPKKGTPVPAHAVTKEISLDKENLKNSEIKEGEIDIKEWLGGNHSSLVTEQAQDLGAYGKVLTVLSYSGDIEEIINGEEGKLLERWTPKF